MFPFNDVIMSLYNKQIDSERWYQLSGLDILVTATGEGNVTAKVDILQTKNGAMISLMGAPPQVNSLYDFRY